MDDESFRMIANPYRLVKECAVVKDDIPKRPSFRDGLRDLIETEYRDIYINPLIHRKIHTEVEKIITHYLIDKLVDEEISIIIESCL